MSLIYQKSSEGGDGGGGCLVAMIVLVFSMIPILLAYLLWLQVHQYREENRDPVPTVSTSSVQR